MLKTIWPCACVRALCLKRKSEKAKIARPKINNQKCPPSGRTSNYRKSWAPRPQQLETPRLQKNHCHQLWYSLLLGADTRLFGMSFPKNIWHNLVRVRKNLIKLAIFVAHFGRNIVVTFVDICKTTCLERCKGS